MTLSSRRTILWHLILSNGSRISCANNLRLVLSGPRERHEHGPGYSEVDDREKEIASTPRSDLLLPQDSEMTWLRSLQPDSKMHRFNPLGLYNILEQTFCLGFQSLPHFLGPQEFTLLQASLCPRTKEQSAVKNFNTSLEGKQLAGTRKYIRGINTKSSIHQSYKIISLPYKLSRSLQMSPSLLHPLYQYFTRYFFHYIIPAAPT
jgi:hypothetical protein